MSSEVLAAVLGPGDGGWRSMVRCRGLCLVGFTVSPVGRCGRFGV